MLTQCIIQGEKSGMDLLKLILKSESVPEKKIWNPCGLNILLVAITCLNLPPL